MRYPVLAAVIVLAVVPAAYAQTTAPSPADEAKFKAADKNSNGALEGGETDAYKANMTQIDTNKDGKLTREEFFAALKSGLIR
ncbi:MAG TPA: hypothetical protein VG758_05300 [Hyphomicrobiaceae bacterium]|jgi:hypothetical protein|nr:hypothetical protein [Hyphomicrobiaceae bacterium]